MNIGELLSGISWRCYTVAVSVTFALGVLWYSVIFAKARVRVFKVEMPGTMSAVLVLRTMGIQFAISALFGLWFFVLTTNFGFEVAVMTLCVFCGWQKGMLNFRFSKFTDYAIAAVIDRATPLLRGWYLFCLPWSES